MRRLGNPAPLAALLMAGTAMLAGAGTAIAAELAPDAPDPIRAAPFDDTTFTLHARTYLFDSSSAGSPGSAAWAIGG